MYLTLNNFDEFIEPRFIDRGLYYYLDGSVTLLNKDSKNTWSAKVQGAKLYSVKVTFQNENIQEYDCNCPYEETRVCKHIVAVLFAVKEKLEKLHNPGATEGSNKQEPSLDDILKELKSFSLSKKRFDYFLFAAVNAVYSPYELCAELNENKISKLSKGEAKEILKNLDSMAEQANSIYNILIGLDYDGKNMDRLLNMIGYMADEIPSIKRKLIKSIS